MTIWTITKETSLRFQHSPQGWPPVFGGVELTVFPAPAQSHIEVENLDVTNPDSAKWFAHLNAGFEEYQAERQGEGRPIGACRLSVNKIISHEQDTTARVMKLVGNWVLRELFTQHLQQITIE